MSQMPENTQPTPDATDDAVDAAAASRPVESLPVMKGTEAGRSPSAGTPAADAPRTNPHSGLPVSAPQAAWPERVDTGPQQVSYRIRVNAPAAELWELLADPHRHHEVDGSATVQYTRSGPTRLAVGDEFSVAMRKAKVPYTMRLVTTAADEGRVVEWKHPGGHRWRWQFEDLGDGSSLVTETFDYSWTRPAVARVYELIRRPSDNANGIRASLTRLAGRYL